ncbi:MAG: SpoIIE family protein phosphatase [Lentisphaeria bacterium]|nr:SpoIIE family protein phosphatase [Lentisphaeria bacterium]
MLELIEVSYYNLHKHNEVVPGDTFLVNKTNDKRIVAALADGMGSGVKANVLSQLTASMSQKFIMEGIDPIHAAQTIISTLPVCSKRNVSYSTLTALDIYPRGLVKILEYDNPDLIWIRGQEILPIKSEETAVKTGHTRNKIKYSEIQLKFGDRLVFFSDGVNQSGMGSKKYPFGWEEDNVKNFILSVLSKMPTVSSADLSKQIVLQAYRNDASMPKDDITCAVAYFRKSRNTLVLTGPPSVYEKNINLIDAFSNFEGKRIISGGTTSQIISKGIGEPITVDMNDLGGDIPPRATMKGADLVSEGMLTMNRAIRILEEEDVKNIKDENAAYRMVQLLLGSDSIEFLVGTAINEAHQSPNMPIEMGLRRITINKLANLLQDKYLKNVTVKYI